MAQLPPLNPRRPCFSSATDARNYLATPRWRPKSGSYGVPRSNDERMVYVKLVYDAIIHIHQVHDIIDWPEEAKKYRVGGREWGYPEFIEAISHKVIDVAISIHERGATGLQFPRLKNLGRFSQNDELFTFPQRIYFMSILFRYYKFNTSLVMRQEYIEQYLANVWSTLMEKKAFTKRYNLLTEEQRVVVLEEKPYEDVPPPPPTPQERAQWVVALNPRTTMSAAAGHQGQMDTQTLSTQQAKYDPSIPWYEQFSTR